MTILSMVGCSLDAGSVTRFTTAPWESRRAVAAESSIAPLALVDEAPSGPVSLETLLAYADTHAPSLTVARTSEALGDAEVEAAQPLLQENPEVDVSLGSSTFVPNLGTYLEAGTAVRQRFEIAGERRARIEAAKRRRDVIGQQVHSAEWSLHQQVHSLYFVGLVALQQLEMADRTVSFAVDLLKIAEGRVAAGDTGTLPLIVARAEVAQARQTRVAARREVDVTLLRLSAVVGWPPEQPLRLRDTLPDVRPAPEVGVLVEKARRHQPQLLVLEREVIAAEARVTSEDRERFPEPSLGVSYAREGQGAAGQFGHVVVGTVSLPIPFWQRNQGGRARARANLGVARAERGAIDATLAARLSSAKVAVDAAAERAEIYALDIVPAFDDNLAKVLRAYELGEIDIVGVSQIQGRILDTQRAALEARADYYRAAAELESLLGTEVW